MRRFLLHYHDGSVPPPLPRSSIFARFVETPQRIIYKGLSDKKASKKLLFLFFDSLLYAKEEGSTRLVYTGLRGGLEHLRIETRLIDERLEIKRESLFIMNR